MKLVAERTVAHKVWQLLPVAQARRGQRSLSSKLEEDEKKMANQGRRRSSVQDVSGCACGYVRLRPGRVERGGRLLRPSHPGDPWPAANGQRNVHMCWRGEDEGRHKIELYERFFSVPSIFL